MGSWHYTFFFPGINNTLTPINTTNIVEQYKLEYDDDNIYLTEIIDDEGHFIATVERKIFSPYVKEIHHYLNKKEMFLSGFSNHEIFFSAGFYDQSNNPHLTIGWPAKSFRCLSKEKQDKYWQMQLDYAVAANAGFVILIDDVPDFLEDQFLEIDGQRYFEKIDSEDTEFFVNEIWVHESEKIPIGIQQTPIREVGKGFYAYLIE